MVAQLQYQQLHILIRKYLLVERLKQLKNTKSYAIVVLNKKQLFTDKKCRTNQLIDEF
jgi:hypothetical protein